VPAVIPAASNPILFTSCIFHPHAYYSYILLIKNIPPAKSSRRSTQTATATKKNPPSKTPSQALTLKSRPNARPLAAKPNTVNANKHVLNRRTSYPKASKSAHLANNHTPLSLLLSAITKLFALGGRDSASRYVVFEMIGYGEMYGAVVWALSPWIGW
jgi:hypothetical protein